ncbi:hypothetical protein AHAS_Ahas03G0223700 [Arachis hypogaea]
MQLSLLRTPKTGDGSWNYFIKTWGIIRRTSRVLSQICSRYAIFVVFIGCNLK